MKKDNFITLFRKIESSKVFQNTSSNPQALVELQLMVALANMGLSGNGGQVALVGNLLGVSGGCLCIIQERHLAN
jgi:hypothetical protein